MVPARRAGALDGGPPHENNRYCHCCHCPTARELHTIKRASPPGPGANTKHHIFPRREGRFRWPKKLSTQFFWCLVSAPKRSLSPPVGHYFLGSIFSEGGLCCKTEVFFQRNASRTLHFVRSYQRVVRSTKLTLESSEAFLWRERRATLDKLNRGACIPRSCLRLVRATNGMHVATRFALSTGTVMFSLCRPLLCRNMGSAGAYNYCATV
jgi:hypothetical protein